MHPLEIIEEWINVAARNRLGDHKKHFWTVRDVLEGRRVEDQRRAQAIEFLRGCRQSRELTILLEALSE